MTSDQWHLVLIAGAWSAGVGLLGVLAVWLLRRRSVRWTAALLVLVAVGGIVAGVIGTSRAMFLSRHDFAVVLLVCAVSGVVSTAFAVWVARSIVASARALRDAAGRVGESRSADPADPAGSAGFAGFSGFAGFAELAEVAEELDHSSERLREAAERERRLEASRRELVAWVSHDLRSPLAGIRAMAESLEDGIAADPHRYHVQMRTEVDQMVGMVDDLFELSRINAGTLQLVPETVPLHDLVSETLASTEALAQAHGVHLDGAVDTPGAVRADPNSLSRVMANLVLNAIRHTPDDGVVAIRAGAAQEGEVELSVSDMCGGIPEEDLCRVFDVAWRGTEARTPASGGPSSLAGAGLGLAIVKGIVDAHRGSVSVSNVGGGCRFVVRLPAPVPG